MKEVLRTNSLSWAHSARIALEGEGLQAVLFDEHFQGIGMGGSFRVAVPEAEAERAAAVIAALGAGQPKPTATRSFFWLSRGLKLIAAGIILTWIAGALSEALPRAASLACYAGGVALIVWGIGCAIRASLAERSGE